MGTTQIMKRVQLEKFYEWRIRRLKRSTWESALMTHSGKAQGWKGLSNSQTPGPLISHLMVNHWNSKRKGWKRMFRRVLKYSRKFKQRRNELISWVSRTPLQWLDWIRAEGQVSWVRILINLWEGFNQISLLLNLGPQTRTTQSLRKWSNWSIYMKPEDREVFKDPCLILAERGSILTPLGNQHKSQSNWKSEESVQWAMISPLHEAGMVSPRIPVTPQL